MNQLLLDEISVVENYFRLSRDSTLYVGKLRYALDKSDVISVNGTLAPKPYLGTTLSENNVSYTALILSPPELDDLQEIAIKHENSMVQWRPAQGNSSGNKIGDFTAYIQNTSVANAKKLLFLLMQYLCSKTDLRKDELFNSVFREVRNRLKGSEILSSQMLRPQDHMLLLDIHLPPRAYDHTLQIIAETTDGIIVMPASLSSFPSYDDQDNPIIQHYIIGYIDKSNQLNIQHDKLNNMTLLFKSQVIPIAI